MSSVVIEHVQTTIYRFEAIFKFGCIQEIQTIGLVDHLENRTDSKWPKVEIIIPKDAVYSTILGQLNFTLDLF